MTEYIHLVGAEQVQSAANSMWGAGDKMSQAASSMQQAVSEHQRILDNFLVEFRDTLEAASRDSALRTALTEIASGDPDSDAGPLIDIAKRALL